MLKQKNYYRTVGWVVLFVISCSKDNNNTVTNTKLELLESFKVNVIEPSGLAINDAGTILYTVSDNNNNIYKLSNTGNVLQTFDYSGNDLEGVSVAGTNKLLLAEERTKEIVEFEMSTGRAIKHKIEYNNKEDNSGIEGVAFNKNDNTVFILNEKNPGLLLRLRTDYTIIAQYELNFASDYSGVFHESESNTLWIVSDQNKTVNKCNLKGELIQSYPIPVTKAEGIAIANDKIFIMSDAEEKLYIFKNPIE